MPEPILVIICGKQPTIALGVKNALQPEYEGATILGFQYLI